MPDQTQNQNSHLSAQHLAQLGDRSSLEHWTDRGERHERDADGRPGEGRVVARRKIDRVMEQYAREFPEGGQRKTN